MLYNLFGLYHLPGCQIRDSVFYKEIIKEIIKYRKQLWYLKCIFHFSLLNEIHLNYKDKHSQYVSIPMCLHTNYICHQEHITWTGSGHQRRTPVTTCPFLGVSHNLEAFRPKLAVRICQVTLVEHTPPFFKQPHKTQHESGQGRRQRMLFFIGRGRILFVQRDFLKNCILL